MPERTEAVIDVPPPGFRGLYTVLPVERYQRHLPHWRQEGATYFVTFRLADSLPQAKLAELRQQREVWRQMHPEADGEEFDTFALEQMARIERWLDAGFGSCVLKKASARRGLDECLRRFDGERYELGAFVIVSNHAHVVVKPLGAWSLEQVDGAWKQYSAKCINRTTGRRGRVWQSESFDRIVRDTPHLRRVLKYLEGNWTRSGGAGSFWVRPDWREWLAGDGGAGQ
jgi:putative transposase